MHRAEYMAFHSLRVQAKVPFAVTAALFVLYTVAVAATVGLFEHQLAKDLGQYQAPWSVALVAVCTLITGLLVQRLFQRVEDLHLRNRMTVDYFPAGGTERPDLSARMYQAASSMLECAKEDGTCEILAVNAFHEFFAPPAAKDDKDAHASYFKVLEEKLGKVDYHRIVQCEDVKELSKRLSEPYRTHFQKTIAIRDGGSNHTTRLDLVPPIYATAYVIVENQSGPSQLIWQLNEYVPDEQTGKAVFRPRGLLLISDPEKQLIRHFKDWFNRLANNSNLRPVTASDISSAGIPK